SLPVDLLLVRDDDIPGLIADGVCDLGVVGRNELDEQAGARAQVGLPQAYRELRGLGFGQCRLMLAVPEDWDWTGPAQLRRRGLGLGRCRRMLAVPEAWDWTGPAQLRGRGLRIATSYPSSLSRWLQEQQIDAQVVELSGSVEIAPRLGTAELICDLVSSGATLKANQLKPVETLLESEAVLAGPVGGCDDARAALAQMLLRRMAGV